MSNIIQNTEEKVTFTCNSDKDTFTSVEIQCACGRQFGIGTRPDNSVEGQCIETFTEVVDSTPLN
jgi:hypothetical protein